MSEINLGKVMLSWQGEYDNAKTYTRLDAVSYNGSSYISLNGSVGVLPTNAEYWGKLAQAGKDGSAATAQAPDLTQLKSDVASNSTAVASAASTANAASAAASQANQAVQAIDLSPLERNITDNSTAASSAYALASSAMSEAQAGGATINTDILNANAADKTPDKYKDGFTYEMRYASQIGITMSDYVLNPPTVMIGLLTTKTYKLSAMQLAHQIYEVAATGEPYIFIRNGTTTKASNKTISKWTDWVLIKTSKKLSDAEKFGGTVNKLGGGTMAVNIQLSGAYNETEDNKILKVVNFGGKSYVAIRANKGVLPTDTEYWALVEKGEPGPAGHSPKVEVKDNFLWIDGKKSAFLQGPTGSMAETNVLPADADLNDYKNNGFFIAANIKTKNSPFHDTGVGTDLFVMTVISRLGLYVKQEITDLNNNITYVRTNKSYEWSKWQKLSGSEVS